MAFGQPSYRSNIETFTPSGVTTHDAFHAYDIVLNNSGARPADRDLVDNRIIQEVRDRTGHFIDSQNDVGGWPDLKENYRILEIPVNPHQDDDLDGYTNLEEWLHNYSKNVESVSQSGNQIERASFTDFLKHYTILFPMFRIISQRLGLLQSLI